MRLDKYLAGQTGHSRKQIKEEIKKGRVTVNGAVCREAEFRIDQEKDEVSLEGRRIAYSPLRCYMLNKPAGVVSSTKREPAAGEDLPESEPKTVLELLPKEERQGLSPVGRLDKDTEGLLLLTDDGALLHRLISPKSHIGKLYEVHLEKEISEEEIRRLRTGVDIGDEKPTACAECERRGTDENGFPVIALTIFEGRYHQVKRMAGAIGNKVIYLKRLAVGGLLLDPKLKPGEYRSLTREELSLVSQAPVLYGGFGRG